MALLIILLIASLVFYFTRKKAAEKYMFPYELRMINEGGHDETQITLDWVRDFLGNPGLFFTVLDTDSKEVVFTDYGIAIRGKGLIPYNSIQSIGAPQVRNDASVKNSGWFRYVTVTLKDKKQLTFQFLNIKDNAFAGMIRNIQAYGVPRQGVEYVENDAILADGTYTAPVQVQQPTPAPAPQPVAPAPQPVAPVPQPVAPQPVVEEVKAEPAQAESMTRAPQVVESVPALAPQPAPVVEKPSIQTLDNGLPMVRATGNPQVDEHLQKAYAGDVVSQRVLGIMYANGQEVAKDEEIAKCFLRVAAAQGDQPAKNVLSVLEEAAPAPTPAPTPAPAPVPVPQPAQPVQPVQPAQPVQPVQPQQPVQPKATRQADPTYSPWGTMNLVLGGFGSIAIALAVYLIIQGGMSQEPLQTLGILAAGIALVAWLFVRNLKLGDMKKTVLNTFLLVLVGTILFAVTFLLWVLENAANSVAMVTGGSLRYKSFFSIMNSLLKPFKGKMVSASDFRSDDDGYDYGTSSYQMPTGSESGTQPQGYEFSREEDVNAQMLGYADAQQYQDSTGYSGHNIDPNDDYLKN
ncbi:MAG: hypothetical protein K6E48_07395 [Lachnospiraceae bacterium]|nr:hypothetical protein [Lachnospiraceae bacterium]